VQPEQLVVHQPVEELKAAGPQEQAGPGPAGRQRVPAEQIRQHEPAGHKREQLRRVEQPVRQQAQGGRAPVVEVVPGQDLVEDDLVHRGHQADADQRRAPAGAGGGALSRALAHRSLLRGSLVKSGGQPRTSDHARKKRACRRGSGTVNPRHRLAFNLHCLL
jgi:hypothetical protein